MNKDLTIKIDGVKKKVMHLIDQNRKLVVKKKELEEEIKMAKQSFENELRKSDELNNQIKIIRLARNIGTAETERADITELKRKINEYIKEIDHCLTMLNDWLMSGKKETVNINVLIAERLYPLKVTKSDEEKLRNAVKLVNEKIKEYQTLYDGKDKQDYVAMCLLNFAVEHVNLQESTQHNNRLLEEKIIQLEEVLSDVSK